VLADGKLLIAASDDSPGSTHDLMILRLNANGTLDETFVSGGMTRIPIPYQQPAIADIVVAADGRFTVLAFDAGQPPTITALRFLPDGTLDPTFGEGAGRARLDGEMDFVSAGGMQSDGKLVILGALGDDLRLIRLTPEGVYDTSFGDEGDVVTSLTMRGMNRGTLAVLPDDTLLVLGNQGQDGADNYSLTRYKSKGILDVSFGNAGSTALPDNLLDPTFTVLPDGKIVAGGMLDGNFMMIRYESHGRQDRSFGVQGYVTLDLPEDIHIEAMAAQPDGKIIAVGSLGGGERSSLGVFRFNANGSFDPTFRAEAVDWPFAGESPVTALGIAPDGGVVIGGVLGEGDRREVYAARFEGR
jgi:uncharacterized delta-60 repeat protein